MKTIFSLLLVFSLMVWFSCDNDDNDHLTLEDAKFLAFSLEKMKKATLNNLESHTSFQRHPVNIQINGSYIGHAVITGTDTVDGVGGHTGGVVWHDAGLTFNLTTYSDVQNMIIENEGTVKYNSRSYERSSYCYPSDQCPSRDFKDTLEISSPALTIIMNKDDKKIQDIVEIKFLYTRSFESLKEVVNDSSHYNHYFIKTSNGSVFEW